MQDRKRHMNSGGHFIFILHRTFVVAVVLHTRHASRQKANTKKFVGFSFYPKTHGNKYISFSQNVTLELYKICQHKEMVTMAKSNLGKLQ